MRPLTSTMVASVLLLASAAGALSEDPLAHADVVSSIGLARVADEAGDELLATWLKAQPRRDLTLAAVRASPYAYAPERLIPLLMPLLCGRDPVLAPEAAVVLVAIADRLSPLELAAREAALSDLRDAKASLACVDAQPAPRADLLSAALVLQASLVQLTPQK